MDVTAKAFDHGGSSQEQKEQVEHSSKSSSSPSQQTVKLQQQPMSSKEEEDELQSTKAEISEVKQENERLRTALSEAIMNYKSLQTQFSGIIQKDHEKTTTTTTAPAKEEEEEEGEEVSLSLGASASCHRHNVKKEKEKEKNKVDANKLDGELELGLKCGFNDHQRTVTTKVNQLEEWDDEHQKADSVEEEMKEDEEEGDETEEEEKKEGWASRKILKNARGKGEDEDLHYSPVKKARVSVRARCDGVMMNDGCQWRKYGQKIAKGNPCPRSYYRCTVAAGCPVRKQVQRCAEDMSILSTTYEGKHNHPIPPAATAMVATTSAAMNMLLSGSSSSRPGMDALTSTAAVSANLNCFNFSLSDNLRARQYLSISPSHPTITIDLTSPESSTSQAMQVNRYSTSFTSPGLRNFPATFNYPSLESTPSAPSWSGGYHGYHGTQLHANKSQFAPLNIGAQTQESFYRSSMQKLSSIAPSTSQHSLTDTISAATKAITSDPSFQSALAATVASVLGGKRNHDMEDTISRIMERGDHLSSVLPYSSSWKGNLPNHQTSLAFSNHKSSSSPPVDKE